jgi:REP element-mobilizing transposase RayT
VVARGNHQQRLFYTPQDYRFYLSLLQEAVERFGLRILAYALLPNHVHLLCRRGPVPLAKVMHHVQRRFAVHLNRRLGLRGHVFQDRYYARLCEDEEYLWAVVRYIHDNPVQAGLCDSPQAYPWSSGPEYATGGSGLVDREEVASLFGAPERVRDLPGKARSSPDRPKGITGPITRAGQGAEPGPDRTPGPRGIPLLRMAVLGRRPSLSRGLRGATAHLRAWDSGRRPGLRLFAAPRSQGAHEGCTWAVPGTGSRYFRRVPISVPPPPVPGRNLSLSLTVGFDTEGARGLL